jgi:hypothetical protein
VAAIIRITSGNFRLLNRLLTQMERILEINSLRQVTRAVVEAAVRAWSLGSLEKNSTPRHQQGTICLPEECRRAHTACAYFVTFRLFVDTYYEKPISPLDLEEVERLCSQARLHVG